MSSSPFFAFTPSHLPNVTDAAALFVFTFPVLCVGG